ncbi:alpha/beta fold hydrolase [Nocardioides taihuensis]|uniref:Alpha/beta fold hydrolase n=1 Tax=Nocardioides taihuensis TaxID=1835606 RepID=A0ABW0BMX2_9ACTN
MGGGATRRDTTLAALALAALLVTGCSSSDRGAGGDAGGSTATTSGPAPELASLAERCLSQIPEPDLVERQQIDDPRGLHLVAGVFLPDGEDAEAAVVLLHQIGGAGLCGWGPWATHAAHAGVAAVAIDLCGYAQSRCAARWNTDPATQVEVAADWAREQLGVSRVVVAGASMGGSQTVRAVADGAPVDAWADVSGPSAWDGVPLSSVAARVDRPGLVVYARSDGAAEFRAARQLARRTGATFVEGRAGHGWELLTRIQDGELTPVGRTLLELVEGR